MDKSVLAFIEKLELFKTKIKALHWDANSLSQHELCDDIADRIAEFQDQVSEVEQSISGKLPKEMFKPSNQEYGEVGTLKEFVENVIEHTNTFYKKLESKGDKYIGMRSDCESFLSDMQRKLYLVNFTLKEELKKRLRDKINEGYRKEENIRTVFPGTKPSSDGGILKRLDAISSSKNGQFNSRTFDSMEDAFDFFKRNLEKVGSLEYKDTVDDMIIVSLNADNGKTYKGMIDFIDLDDGKCKASIKFSNLGKESEFNEDFENNDLRIENNEIRLTEDDFMSRWFDKNEEDHLDKARKGLWKRDIENFYNRHPDFRGSNGKVEEGINENKQIKLTEAELKQVVKEAAMKILSETPLNYDIDNFSGRWNKSEPSDEEWALADSAANGDYLDSPFNPPNSWDDDDWVDGDKDMENDYSWDLYHRMNNVGKSPVDRQHDIMDAAQNRRDHAAYWTDRDNERGNRLMSKWVDGKRDLDDLEDADFSYDPYKYNESKKPMKVTESELKQVVKEAAINLIKEYTQKQANTKGFIRSTHGNRKSAKKPKQARGSFGDKENKLLKQLGKEVDESSGIEIKPENKGKFTATKKATGKSTEELTHSKNPLTRKRANFAKMAKRGWKPLKK